MKEPTQTMHYGATGKIFEYSRILRLNMTSSEKILWKFIAKRQLLGLKFRCQHPIGNYIADFYCHEKKLVIEVDGKYHEEKYQKISDQYRDNEMERFNIKVIRLTNEQIVNDKKKIMDLLTTLISFIYA